MQCSGQIALDFFNTVDDIDEENQTREDSNGTDITVPQGRFALTEEHLHELQTLVNPLQESENHGIELYERTLTFVHYIVSQNPHLYNS